MLSAIREQVDVRGKITGAVVITFALVILLGFRSLAPSGVYVRSCTMDSLDVVSSAVEVSRSISLGLIYPDTATCVTASLKFDVSRDNSTWFAWRDSTDSAVEISVNQASGGFISLTGLGGASVPGYIRVRLGAEADTCRVAAKTWYFVTRQGG